MSRNWKKVISVPESGYLDVICSKDKALLLQVSEGQMENRELLTYSNLQISVRESLSSPTWMDGGVKQNAHQIHIELGTCSARVTSVPLFTCCCAEAPAYCKAV